MELDIGAQKHALNLSVAEALELIEALSKSVKHALSYKSAVISFPAIICDSTGGKMVASAGSIALVVNS